MQSKPVVYTRDAIEEKEVTDIDRDKLIQYLSKNMRLQNWNNCTIHRSTTGNSNRPYILNCGSNKFILRTKYENWGIIERHYNLLFDIKRQYQLISLLNIFTNVPVPKMYLFCDDETIIGKTFYVMEFIDARIFTHIAPDLPTVPKEDRIKVYTELVRVLGLIHSVDIHTSGIWNLIKNQTKVYADSVFIEWMDDYPKSNDKNITQNVIHFKQVIKDKVMQYKRKNRGSWSRFTTLIHGDFHWENILWHPTEYKIIAVVDWEGCSSGNPFLELASVCGIYVGYETESVEPQFEYFPGFKHTDVKQLGIPTMNEQIISYMNVVKKALSRKTFNEMDIWLKRPINWPVAMALNCYKMISGFYQIVNEQQEKKFSKAFTDRQYSLFDAMADTGLHIFNQETVSKSKL